MKTKNLLWLFASLLWDDKSRLIKRLDNSSVNLSFETGSLPAGLYFLRLIVNGKVETVEKIIKIQ